MQKVLFVIDMQHDFVDGVLGSEEAKAIVKNVKAKVEEFDTNKLPIVYTQDTHNKDTYATTKEGKDIPTLHCVGQTKGWTLIPEVLSKRMEKYNYTDVTKITLMAKNQFGGFINIYAYKQLLEKQYGIGEDFEFTVVGLCTDLCVLSNAVILQAAFPNATVIVDASCCAGTTPEKHKTALQAMKNLYIKVANE